MIKRLNIESDCWIYRLKVGDTLESVAQMFQVSVEELKQANPLFSNAYSGCVLLINGIGRKRVVVGPMQTLEDVARHYNTTKEEIVKLNNLKSDRVFVGMQLYIKEKNCEKNIV